MADFAAFGLWWLAVTIIGWLAWPLAATVLRRLPDKGLSLTKGIGLLVASYLYWVLGAFGFLQTNLSGVLVALALLLAISAWCLTLPGRAAELRDWLAANWRTALLLEGLFLLGFGLWAYVRALNPEIVATEKPMEFAFLNSVLASGNMPPRDPWLSGYAISYYYFGYVMMGMLTELTQVLPSMAFNLAVALLFGLTFTHGSGVVLNLIALTRRSAEDAPPRDLAFDVLPAALGGLLVAGVGNFNGLLEVLHHRALLPGQFWTWLNIENTDFAPTMAGEGWIPSRYLWWWQSSRVLRDLDLQGNPIGLNPIDEFPFFSFLLGDVHPHVLALPFVVLAVGVALNLFLLARSDEDAGRPFWLPLAPADLLFGALVLGALAFLNTWDFPIYVFVTVAGYLVARQMWLAPQGLATSEAVWGRAAVLGGTLTIVGVLLYLPFYIGFRSQAGGVLPNPVHSTRLVQFVVMFGPTLPLSLLWLGWVAFRQRYNLNWGAVLSGGGGLLAGLALIMTLMMAVIIWRAGGDPATAGLVNSLLGGVPIDQAISLIAIRRFTDGLLVPLLLAIMIGLACGLIFTNKAADESEPTSANTTPDTLAPFVAVLVATAALLTLGSEFLYLRDAFGVRMNTVFKFYYQAWVLWALAGAFGVWHIARFAARHIAIGHVVLAAVLVAAGLVYSVLGTYTKTEAFQGTTFDENGERYATLDGMAYMRTGARMPDYWAMMWARDNIPQNAVILEGVGGSYSEFARVSAHTGLATVLGWPFHQFQWRGSYEPVGSREADVEQIYRARTWPEVIPLLERYQIRYVYVGPAERNKYGTAGLLKFETFMDKIYDAEGVQIYRRR